MRILFMGTPDFAVKSLESLIENKIIPVAVVTTPDKPQGRGLKLTHSKVKEKSLSLGLPIYQPEKLRDENFISILKNLNLDLIVVVAFRILPKELLSIPKYGAINLHASLLPKYRGAAPINWAIINGENESGVTTFFLDEKTDTGKIIFQEKCKIENEISAGELYDLLAKIGSQLLIKTICAIETGNTIEFSQNDFEATPAPKIFKKDCQINWNSDTENIYNFIRGLSPFPTAWTTFKSKTLKIYKSKISKLDLENKKPGTIIKEKNKLYVATPDGFLELLELQIEGGKKISGDEFIRGYQFETANFGD
ncbi:MAG: methionyl-tRNA formyltransferase [Bacteroidota bacterium]